MTLPDKLFTETCVFFHFRNFRILAISQGKMALSSSENEVWLGAESNRRHEDFQSSALPTELPSLLPMKLPDTAARIRIIWTFVPLIKVGSFSRRKLKPKQNECAKSRCGREAMGLPLNELAAIVQARLALAKYGKSINDAAGFYLDHLERIRRCNITVAQLAAEVLAAKQKDGFGVLYLTDLRKRLNRFARDFGTRPIAAIIVEEMDDWLRNLECAPKTRANFRANIGVLFSYAERRRMIRYESGQTHQCSETG